MHWFNYWLLFTFMAVIPWGVFFGVPGLIVQLGGLLGYTLIILEII